MTPFFDAADRRDMLLAEVAAWIGTPFKAHQAVKGVAADCVCMTAEIMVACGLIAGYEFPRYSLDWAKHHDRSLVIEWLDACPQVQRMPDGDPEQLRGVARLGDVLGFKIGRCVHHAGVMLGGREFLNSIEGARVTRCRLDDSTWAKRLNCVYRPVALV